MKKTVWIVLTLCSLPLIAYFSYSYTSKHLTVEIPINEVKFPIQAENLDKVDFFRLLSEVKSHKDTLDFINGDLKLRININNEASHKIHHKTIALYELGIEIINSDPDLNEVYEFAIAEEILGLNARLSEINGLVQSLEDKHGRDYLYQQADPK